MGASDFDSVKINRRLEHKCDKVIVTSARLRALNATVKTLVAAPGAGKVLIFKSLVVHKPAGIAYAGVHADEDLAVKYTGSAGAQVNTSLEVTGFLDQVTAQTRYTKPIVTEVTPVVNAALVLHMLTGEITTGDSPLICTVEYDIIDEVTSQNVSF